MKAGHEPVGSHEAGDCPATRAGRRHAKRNQREQRQHEDDRVHARFLAVEQQRGRQRHEHRRPQAQGTLTRPHTPHPQPRQRHGQRAHQRRQQAQHCLALPEERRPGRHRQLPERGVLEAGVPVEGDDLGGRGARHERSRRLVVGQALVAQRPQPQRQRGKRDAGQQPCLAPRPGAFRFVHTNGYSTPSRQEGGN